MTSGKLLFMKPFLFLLISIFIGFCSWNVVHASPLIFVAIVPFLFGIYYLKRLNYSELWVISIYILVFKFFWVYGQVYWLKDVTYDTFFAAVISHTICFFIIQIPAIITFSKKDNDLFYYLFLLSWVLFEYFMQNFALLSPFYILGVMLGEYTTLIQSYSWIGIEGGTVWILITNLLVFLIVKSVIEKKVNRKVLLLSLFAFLPLVMGALIQLFHADPTKKLEVAALHTNFNPSMDAYSQHPEKVMDSLWRLSSSIDSNTDVLMWPETIVTSIGWMQTLQENPMLDSLRSKLKEYPKLNLTFGANIYSLPSDQTDKRLNYNEQYNLHYFVHNVALTVNNQSQMQFRSKEVFVPFQEAVPYVQTFPSLKKLITIVGNQNLYAEYENDTDMHLTPGGVSYIPLLCYEICYPLFTSAITKDVDFVAVLGNEHWNSSAKGSRLYFHILKSITAQNAKPLIKSSNNGVSVIMDWNGQIVASKSFDDTGLLKANISASNTNSFYSYVSGYTYVLALLALLYVFVFMNRKKKIQ
jgi:apolipoprotein N-acyltransferase